ncbi:uncharacterized protein LOC143257164 [Tachypleus tridentatus]|uniref:uncharacterized protein LOC143257164 n=1 Tax=Tachypleus tridentatus TaxID=6853 RepID=UPI003FD45E7C
MVFWKKMIPIVSFLAALRLLTKAQLCNNGHGQLVYEMVANYKLSGNNGFGFAKYETITKRDMPVKVLEECIRRCQEDRTTSIQKCLSFDFMPSRRRSGVFIDPGSGSALDDHTELEETESVGVSNNENMKGRKLLSSNSFREAVVSNDRRTRLSASDVRTKLYGDSSCHMYYDRASPDGSDRLVREMDAWHFNEICLTSPKLRHECSNRLYVFERTPGFRFDGEGDEVFAVSRAECQDKCLNNTLCRSATFDSARQLCKLSKQTKQINPSAYKEDANSDYMENLCLPDSLICSTKAFIMEAGKELDGPYDRDLVKVNDYNKCSVLCTNSLEERGFFCRSFVFDDRSGTCLLYDEDPAEYKDGNDSLRGSSGNYFRVLCGTQERDSLFNNATLERFRRKRLDGFHENEITSYSFQECLDFCMRRYGRDCRSVEFSSRYHSCRFSSYERGWGVSRPNLVDDDFYDYYEFRWYRGDGGFGVGHKGGSWSDSKKGGGWHPRPPPPVPEDRYSERHDGENYNGGYHWSYGGSHGGSGYGGSHGESGYGGSHGGSGYGGSHGGSGYGGSHGGSGYGGSHRGSGYGGSHGGSGYGGSHGGRGYGGSHGGSGYDGSHGGSGYGWSRGGSDYRGSHGGGGYGGGSDHGGSHGGSGYGGSHGGTGYGWSYGGGRYGGSRSDGGSYHPGPPPPLPPGPNSVYPPRLPGPPVPPGPGGLGYPTCADHGGELGDGVFQRVGFGQRLRSFYIRRVVRVDRLEDCERECIETRDFDCRSFNFRPFSPENCELSDTDTTQVQLSNPSHFDDNTQFDYYEKDGSRSGRHCLAVSQSCSPDGMEFSLQTPDGFYGRIYTYGFYDTCFYDGNGGNVNVLRISRANGFPRCGTQQFGDVMTNIVVVQFNDYVQTSRDKVYNLTCYLSGGGETVVTSSYLDTRASGRHPTQIEHLPAQNILTSSVVLRILYRGVPTNTIAVGDLLTFRLETRGQYRYDFFTGDIFATNVIAKDPYSGREVHLLDARGCPIDLYVFPELHRTPDGALEADFYAFKIPDSNLLVFQATVRTCRGPCEPVICSDPGRPGTFPSWGRRKRAVSNETAPLEPGVPLNHLTQTNMTTTPANNTGEDEEEEVHELLNVFLSRSNIPPEGPTEIYETQKVCVAQTGYYTLIVVVTVLICLLITAAIAAIFYRRKAKLALKQADADSTTPSTANLCVSQFQAQRFEDPSEPIYTDPSLFERSRNLCNMAIPSLGNMKFGSDVASRS